MKNHSDREKLLETALRNALKVVKKFPAITKDEHKAKEAIIKQCEKALEE